MAHISVRQEKQPLTFQTAKHLNMRDGNVHYKLFG